MVTGLPEPQFDHSLEWLAGVFLWAHTAMNALEPWISIAEACKRMDCSRKTIQRLWGSGILVRVFKGVRTKGITIESVGHYEAGLEYRAMRERGRVPGLPWSAKDQSPLNHLLVTGHYPKGET